MSQILQVNLGGGGGGGGIDELTEGGGTAAPIRY
jgi:hypothetical protein